MNQGKRAASKGSARFFILRALVGIISTGYLLGCASDALQSKVQLLERRLNEARSMQAEQTTEISGLQDDVRTLRGRIEELEYTQGKRVGGELNSLKENLSNIERRLPPPPIVPAPTLEADESLADGLSPSIQGLYRDALSKIRSGKFREAIPVLDEALSLNYGQQGSAEMSFWRGVAFDGVGDNRGALGAYNDVITNYARHQRVPLALYRQAQVLIRMGDTATARLTLQKLIADYPRAAEAGLARQRLSDL